MPEDTGNDRLSRTSGEARYLYGAALLCALVAGLQYAATIGHGFVLDDSSSVIGAAHTTGGIHLPLFEATRNGQGMFFRPFGYLGFSFDYAVFGPEPWGFHLTCVLLHMLATAALVVLGGMLIGWAPAMVAGLLFAVHPVHVEAVANIWNRTGVQSTLFVFLALIAWLRVKHLGMRVLLVNLLAFVAVGSKEGAIALPVLIVAVEWLKPGGCFDLRGGVAVAPAFVVWYALRRSALGTQKTFGELFTDHPWSVKLYTLGELIAHNARLLVFPLELRADYSEPTTTYLAELTGLSAVGWLIAIGIVTALGVAIVRRHWSALGIGMFVATIWPFMHLVVPLGVPLAERWLYLPSAGICLLIGEGLWRARTMLRPLVHRGAVASLIVCLAALTSLRAAEWESPMSLWEADAAKPGASAFTWGNYSLSLWSEGRHGDALKAMMHARNLKPDWTVYETQYLEMRSMLTTDPNAAIPARNP